MKSTLNIVTILTSLAILASCSSSRPIMDDNVYMLKTAAVPIGENLLDETSYATYKYREDKNNPTTGYYNPENQSVRQNNRSMFNRPVFYYYGMMYPMNSMMGFGYSMNSFPYSHYNPYGYYYNPYGFNSPYGYYNPYGYCSPFGFNNPNSFYGQYGSYGNFYNPGYNNWYNSNNSLSNSNNQGFSSQGHFVSGPRATNSGYYSGINRGGTQQLKSQVPNTTGNSGNPIGEPVYSSSENIQTRPMSNRSVSSQPEYSNTNRTIQTRGESVRYNNQQARPVQTRNNSTYRNSNVNSGQTRTTTIGTSQRQNSSLIISSPTRTNSGGSSTPRSTGGSAPTQTRSKSPSNTGGGVRRN